MKRPSTAPESTVESNRSKSEPDSPASTARSGVFICECGDQIAARLDTAYLLNQATRLPQVAYARTAAYPCSKDGRLALCQAIQQHELSRVLLAGCTPRLVGKLFEDSLAAVGLDPGCLEIVDIREQCAYVHQGEPAQALSKAANLIEMGSARLACLPHAFEEPDRAASLLSRQPFTDSTSQRVIKSALIIGSSLAGLTLALELARANFPVTLVEKGERLGEIPPWSDERLKEKIKQQVEAITEAPLIYPLLGAQIGQISGRAGDYQITLTLKGQAVSVAAGAVLVASEAHPRDIGLEHWLDRRQVKTQAEFADELAAGKSFQDVVMILCGDEFVSDHCSRLCCLTGIQQALRLRATTPQANITILYRRLFLGKPGGAGEAIIQQAVNQGITFFRYPADNPPRIEEKAVCLFDSLTGDTLQVPYECVVLALPLLPQENAQQLAALLHLPCDAQGFLIEARTRLRPGKFTDDGVYVLGGAHQPADLKETLYQAYLTSARVQRFLSQDNLDNKAPTARIDPVLCTGCGECVLACPMSAIHLEKRAGLLSLSEVDRLRCTGCGNCTVVCPVKAILVPGWEDATILAQITAALRPPWQVPASAGTTPAPRLLVLACEWSAYAAADIAGALRLAYPANVRIIRLNCSARFDPNHVLWAFLNGAQAVLIGACPPGECHHGTGNLYARERVQALKAQLAERGIDPRRLHLEFLSADDGAGFVQAIHNLANDMSTARIQAAPPA